MNTELMPKQSGLFLLWQNLIMQKNAKNFASYGKFFAIWILKGNFCLIALKKAKR
jgi:hypothetical protein